MYGFLRTKQCHLTQEQQETYRKFYCGQCAALHKLFGYPWQILVSHDTAFFGMLLAAQQQEKQNETKTWCAIFPKKLAVYAPEHVSQVFSASLAVLVFELKLSDALQDRPSRVKKLLARHCQPHFEQARGILEALNFPTVLFAETLEQQQWIEAQPKQPIEQYAEPSARLFAEIFQFTATSNGIVKNSPLLYELGYHVGKIIYLMDSCIDVVEDVAKQQFNALLAAYQDNPEPLAAPSQSEIMNVTISALNRIRALTQELHLNKHQPLIANVLLRGFPQYLYCRIQRSLKQVKASKCLPLPIKYLPHAALASALCLLNAQEVEAVQCGIDEKEENLLFCGLWCCEDTTEKNIWCNVLCNPCIILLSVSDCCCDVFCLNIILCILQLPKSVGLGAGLYFGTKAIEKKRTEIAEERKKARTAFIQQIKKEFDSLENQVRTIVDQLGIPFTIDYDDAIFQFIDTHANVTLSKNRRLKKLIEEQTNRVQEDRKNLEEMSTLYAQISATYSELSQKAKKTGSLPFQNEVAYLHDIATSDTVKSFLTDRKWDAFRSTIHAILKVFEQLNGYAGILPDSELTPLDISQELCQKVADEFEKKRQYISAGRILERLKKYEEAGIAYEKDHHYRDAARMYDIALQQFQTDYGLQEKSIDERLWYYTEYLVKYPNDNLTRFSCAKAYLQAEKWESAFQHLQHVIDTSSQPVLQGKAIFARAQCFLGRAEGADIMLGFQDITMALSQHAEALSVSELIEVASQLVDHQYLQATGTQVQFSDEYQRIIILLRKEIEQKCTMLFETYQLTQAELFEQSDQLKELFPSSATEFLKNMVSVSRRQMEALDVINQNSVLDVALELRERDLDTLSESLLASMIAAYDKQFKAERPIEGMKLVSFAKKLQEYEYSKSAAQLMQTMLTGYQYQFQKGSPIDTSLMLAISTELNHMGLEQPGQQLLTQVVETLYQRLSPSSSKKLRSSYEIVRPRTTSEQHQENEQELFAFALQLWQNGYHKLAENLIQGIGGSYQLKIEGSISLAQQVMAIADEFWKRAQKNPDTPIFDTIAEQLWNSVVKALEKTLPVSNITKDNVENYYLLFKAYQAVREPIKCGDVGLKILQVVGGFQGYKDVRPIVDNLVTSGFQAQQWQSTGDRQGIQIETSLPFTPPTDKAERFGKYTGIYYTKGGMGEIYKGTAPTGEMVTIKRIPRYSLRGNRSERFLREIQVIQTISHPNIVKVLDVNENEGYYVMEWAEHGTLDGLLKHTGTLPLRQALEITTQIADALEVVHQKDIVHRDIKPQNILMFADNVVKLTDFGVAHVKKGADDPTLTRHGEQPGTPKYMSPEQGMGEPLDNKSDIFSLGLVLYEMITGNIPFVNLRELFKKEIEEISEERSLPIPESVKPVIMKCLRSNANRRYNASELKKAIQELFNRM